MSELTTGLETIADTIAADVRWNAETTPKATFEDDTKIRPREWMTVGVANNWVDCMRKSVVELAYEEQRAYYNAKVAMRLQAENIELRDCLEWALAEIDGRTSYNNPVQAAECMIRARAALGDRHE